MCSLRENIHEIVIVHSVHSNVAIIHIQITCGNRRLEKSYDIHA